MFNAKILSYKYKIDTMKGMEGNRLRQRGEEDTAIRVTERAAGLSEK